MNLNKINSNTDPHGVQYLLGILRHVAAEGDQQQQQYTTPTTTTTTATTTAAARPLQSVQQQTSLDPRRPKHIFPTRTTAEQQDRHPTVASSSSAQRPPPTLEPDLQASTALSRPLAEPRSILKSPAAATAATTASEEEEEEEDVSHLFASSPSTLPHLKRLASSALFLRALMTLKREQDELERTLRREWVRMQKGCDDDDRDDDEVQQWKQMAVQRWDAVADRQQVRLKELNTPGFYPTKSPAARANQHKILDLISGLIENA